jgi:hypothetical protein
MQRCDRAPVGEIHVVFSLVPVGDPEGNCFFLRPAKEGASFLRLPLGLGAVTGGGLLLQGDPRRQNGSP